MTGRRWIGWAFAAAVASAAMPAFGQNVTLDALTSEAPPCKTPKQKRPRLPADDPDHGGDPVHVDVNGDGWCDYLVRVVYPLSARNVKSYSLDQSMLLGSATGWKRALHGKKSYLPPIRSLDQDIWPITTIGTLEAAFIYSQKGGAPYLFGLDVGGGLETDPFDGSKVPYAESKKPGCIFAGYQAAYRWDDVVGAFKRVSAADAKVLWEFQATRTDVQCPEFDAWTRILLATASTLT